MALSFPDIHPDIFTLPAVHLGNLTLGPFPLRWYALAYIAGILLGWRYALNLVRNEKLWRGQPPPASPIQIDDLILWLTLGVIVGGRLGYIVFYMLPLTDGRAALAADPLEALRLWHGGMSRHGDMRMLGGAGVALLDLLACSQRLVDAVALADLVAACVPIGLFLWADRQLRSTRRAGRGRGDLQCASWGMAAGSPNIATGPDGTCYAGYQPRHPSQLYEAALEGAVLFLVLRLATHRGGWLARRGALVGLFLVGYGAFRIALENVRMPDVGLRDLPLGLTVGMMLSAPMVAVGAWLLWRALRAPVPLGHAPS